METRHALEMKMVETLKKVLTQPRKKMAFPLQVAEARYCEAMTRMGFTDGNEIYRAWHDVLDIAELELEARRNVGNL